MVSLSIIRPRSASDRVNDGSGCSRAADTGGVGVGCVVIGDAVGGVCPSIGTTFVGTSSPPVSFEYIVDMSNNSFRK